MKYFYPSLLTLTVISLIFSFFKLKNTNDIIAEYNDLCKIMHLESENYLTSLIRRNNLYADSKIILEKGDTILLTEMKKPSLCYSFSSNDCMSCIEENIFGLIELAKSNTHSNIYIMTTSENMSYLRMMSKIQDISTLNFCYWAFENSNNESFYFMIFKDGEISNIYYPQKNEWDSTKKYLNNSFGMLNTKN
jgi:hypothetical protein